jgi:hypothetical protein
MIRGSPPDASQHHLQDIRGADDESEALQALTLTWSVSSGGTSATGVRTAIAWTQLEQRRPSPSEQVPRSFSSSPPPS